jgi:hypothetical protein
MVIASDVVYLPECVEPLFNSMSFFLKPQTGRCLLVSARVRYDGFTERIESLMSELKLVNEVVEEVVKDTNIECKYENKSKVFRVQLI